MRRYENAQEQKFWQVELTGAEALVEWGKIGGSGRQRSHKKFADETVAATEIEKLVAKKEKEGFTAAGAQRAEPAGETLKIHWREGMNRILPGSTERLDVIDEAAALLAMKTYASSVERGTATVRDELERGFSKNDPTLKPSIRQVMATVLAGKLPAASSTELDTALITLDVPDYAFASLIAARVGLAGLAEAMIAAFPWSIKRGGEDGDEHRYVDDAHLGFAIYAPAPVYRAALFIGEHLPQASDADRAAVRKVLSAAKLAFADPSKLAWRMALATAMNDRDWNREIVEEGLDGKTKRHAGFGESLFDFTDDLALVEKIARRFPNDIRGVWMLMKYGVAAVPALLIAYERNLGLTSALVMVEGLPIAKGLAHGLSDKTAAPQVKAYYDRFPALGVAALEPIVKADSKLSTYARPVLEALLRAHPELGSEVSRPKLEKIAAADRVPSVLATPPATRKVVTLPSWVDGLPQVLLEGGGALPDSAIRNLLLVLRQSTPEAPHPALAEIQRACDEESLAQFGWALFEHWVTGSGSSKDNWAFTALAHLGGDDEARKLAPLVRAWPGEALHGRAVTGLEVLAGIGTDVALMHLHGIAQKVKFKGLQEKAKLEMDALAKTRGLTADELADRLVPDLDLDDNGTLVLDFGPRQFIVGFDETLEPFVAGGLPKPNATDDPEKSTAAVERFKTLKKDAKTLASGQITRLEMAMCAQRRWTAEDFQNFIVDHPVVVHLARRIVFGVYQNGALGLTTFRVAEDRSLVSARDAEVKLAKGAIVGIVHRVEAGDRLVTEWGEHFGRYELLQPFEQLGRAAYAMQPAEKQGKTLDRIHGAKVKTGRVLGLEARGWRKGAPLDGGWVFEMQKVIGRLIVTLPLNGGIALSRSDGTPDEQELGVVTLARDYGAEVPRFGMLAPIVFSELVRDLMQLTQDVRTNR